MAGFAIMKHGPKVRNWAKLRLISGHNDRTRDTPNADPERLHLNERLVGTGDLVADVKGVMMMFGVDPGVVKENEQVLGRELLYTASPEFFRTDPNDKLSPWDMEKVEAWKRDTWEHIEQTWGKRIASAHLHMDETSPHFQVFVVPCHEAQSLEEAQAELAARKAADLKAGTHLKANGKPKVYRLRQKPGRLDAKSIWPTKGALSKFQDQYAKAMAKHGLARGVKNAKVSAQALQTYYGKVLQSEAMMKHQALVNEGVNAVLQGYAKASDDGLDLVPGPKVQAKIEDKDEKEASRAKRVWAGFRQKIEPVVGFVIGFATDLGRRIRVVEQEARKAAREEALKEVAVEKARLAQELENVLRVKDRLNPRDIVTVARAKDVLGRVGKDR